MIEKILERLEAEAEENYLISTNYNAGMYDAFDRAIQIVQEVAKEYGKDTNVRSKEYEKGYEDGWNDCSKIGRIEAPYQKGE
jgi:hypothetical protein